MEDELLEELDRILNPVVQRSWKSAVQNSYGADPSHAFLDLLKVQIDNTKVDLSNVLQKLDLKMQGATCSVERDAADFDSLFPEIEEVLPDVNEIDYVRQVHGGFEVWNGMRWVALSEKANIKVELFQDPDNNNRPAVRVWAYDEATKTNVLFVDKDIAAPGWDLSMTRTGDFGFDYDVPTSNGGYWEDPIYNSAKNSMSIGGMVAGALEINQIGNLTPWRTGNALKNAQGWYRTKEGLLRNLNNQTKRGAARSRVGAKNALERSKVFKGAGRIVFGASVVLSASDGIVAYVSQDTNRKEVAIKATVDIAISVIGTFGGPVGWIVAGTYFILDVSGAFGDWGQRSGISQSDYNEFQRQKFIFEYGSRIKALEFETSYEPSLETQQQPIYLEERTMHQDNTRVAIPKIVFMKN